MKPLEKCSYYEHRRKAGITHIIISEQAHIERRRQISVRFRRPTYAPEYIKSMSK